MATDTSTPLPKNAGSELGNVGTYMPGGIIQNEDYNRNLIGQHGMRKYQIMRLSNSTVHSALQVVKLPMLSALWDVEPAKNADGEVEDKDDYIARLVHHNLFEIIRFKKWLKQSGLSMYDFGHSVSEKVWQACEFDGKPYIGVNLKSRKQTTILKWQTQEGATDGVPGGIPGITQIVGGKFYSVPMEKLFLLTYDREGDNYEGVSLLRYIYRDWDMLDKLTLVNAIALEKLGVGVPMIQAKDPTTPLDAKDEADAILALSNWRANNKSYIKVPANATVEFMDLKGQTTRDILPTLNYHDGRIMTGVLARFMEIGGHSGSGSQSLASVLEGFFMRAQQANAQEIIEAFNDLIKEIVDQNYGPNDLPNGYPKLTVSNISDDDLTALATNVASLMVAGALTADADIEENLRERYNLPAMSKEMHENYEELHQKAAPVATDPNTKEPSAIAKKSAEELKKGQNVEASIENIRAYRDMLLGIEEPVGAL